MMEGLEARLAKQKADAIKALDASAADYDRRLAEILNKRLRQEKVAIKDIKLRTFIAEGASRNDLAAHVYDVTYGVVRETDNLVVIDDSIVRGTTLKQSIIRMLDRLNPEKNCCGVVFAAGALSRLLWHRHVAYGRVHRFQSGN